MKSNTSSSFRAFTVLVLLVGVSLVATSGATAAEVVIDSFDTDQGPLIIAGSPSGVTSVSDATNAAEAAGGERDIILTRTSANTGFVSAAVNVLDPGMFSYGSLSATGEVLIVWDGDDNDATTVDFTGLGGVDLTASGTNQAIAIRTGSDLGASLELTIYSDGVNYSTFVQAVPAGGIGYTLQNFLIPFADPGWTDAGTGVDFTNVGAISLKVLGTTSDVDLTVDFIKAVPEPTSAGLVGLGLTAAGLMLRRKRLSA